MKFEALQTRIAELCNDTKIPYGTFTPELWEESLRLLHQMTHLQSVPSLDCSCGFMDRLVIEMDTQQQQQIHKNSDHLPKLTTASLNAVVKNWNKCWKSVKPEEGYSNMLTPPEMLSRVDDWLYRLDNDANNNVNAQILRPDAATYGMILQGALLRHTDSKAASVFGEKLFLRMVEESKGNKWVNVYPDKMTYANMVHFHCKQGNLRRAEWYLHQMSWEYGRGNRAVKPTQAVVESIMKAYSDMAVGNDGSDNHNKEHIPPRVLAERAENMLRTVQQNSGPFPNLQANRYMYAQVLKCWVFSMDSGTSTGTYPRALSSSDKEALNRVCQLYSEMEHNHDPKLQPDGHTLYLVLQAFCRARDGKGAQEVFDKYVENLKQSKEMENPRKSPDTFCFRQLASAWGEMTHPRAVEKIERLIEQMKSEEFVCAKPDVFVYNALLACLIEQSPKKGGTIGPQCERMLDEMITEHSIKPNTATYNLCLQGHAKDGQDPYLAEAMLERLYEVYLADGSAEPTVRTFNLVLNSWAESSNDTAPTRVGKTPYSKVMLDV